MNVADLAAADEILADVGTWASAAAPYMAAASPVALAVWFWWAVRRVRLVRAALADRVSPRRRSWPYAATAIVALAVQQGWDAQHVISLAVSLLVLIALNRAALPRLRLAGAHPAAASSSLRRNTGA
jgi:hypothetical protein